ncbi:unnamed protein product [Acanthoscelides obtectus]|uniref:Uncharacterized protein n=1 Tax=Acanthoscelides obtectus TaxID=200917 RepID=A0A9P0Q5B2_ACAOB|nr:unnamed protein product [Acanthoscelides obtectus]CAK1635783.1 hypothetical protein AOBTE_LOCUS9499 [Acanthoscelides obtectus]
MEIMGSSFEWSPSNDSKLIVIVNPVRGYFLWWSLKNMYL